MMQDEVLEVLKQIRDEAKQTNVRLESLEGRVEQTNVRLESLEGHVDAGLQSLEGRVEQTNAGLRSLEGRVDFLEKRLSKGFESVTARLDAHVERIDLLTGRQTDSELRLATEVLSLAAVTREVRDLLSTKLDDHHLVADHEERLRKLEDRIADRPEE